jgi:hypothetical protein
MLLVPHRNLSRACASSNGEGMTEIFLPDHQARAARPQNVIIAAKGTRCSSFFGTIAVDQMPQLQQNSRKGTANP